MLLQIQEPGHSPRPLEPSEPAIGIDFGTTHSLVAFSEKGQCRIFSENQEVRDSKLLPSVVCFDTNGILSSDANKATHEIRSIKRLMGKSLEEALCLGYTQFPYDPSVSEGMVHLKLGERSVSPVEIASEIFKTLKARAEKSLNKPLKKAVVTVPAYFHEGARTAIRDAARSAGLDVLRLVNEPTAAALAYGLDEGAEGIYAIYDLGGGTFDISILSLTKGVFQVLATGGNPTLGGDDFDKIIVDHLLEDKNAITKESHTDPSLLLKARKIKEALSFQEQYSMDSLSLTRKTFKTLIDPFIQETLQIMTATLKDAGVTASTLQGIVLVGGSTRIPLISQMIQDTFGKVPLNSLNPDETVVRGAALQAEALTQGAGTLLLDVVPLSLGLETMGDIVEKVIPRNTPIPISKAQDFTTYQDGQTAMKIHVLQGERDLVQDCRSLAHFDLTDIPPLSAGQARIRVTFTVDADGLLMVTAQEKTTGHQQHVEVKPSYGLSPEKVSQLLRESMEKGAQDMKIRLLRQTQVKAHQLIKAVEDALKKDLDLLSSSEKEKIQVSLKTLKSLEGTSQRESLSKACDLLQEQTQEFAEKRLERSIEAALKGQKAKNLSVEGGQNPSKPLRRTHTY